jgi:hypothetical protein
MDTIVKFLTTGPRHEGIIFRQSACPLALVTDIIERGGAVDVVVFGRDP